MARRKGHGAFAFAIRGRADGTEMFALFTYYMYKMLGGFGVRCGGYGAHISINSLHACAREGAALHRPKSAMHTHAPVHIINVLRNARQSPPYAGRFSTDNYNPLIIHSNRWLRRSIINWLVSSHSAPSDSSAFHR